MPTPHPMAGAPSRRQQPVASIWPLVTGAVATAVGGGLAIWTGLTANFEVFVGEVRLPFADVSTLPLSVGGYLLTPFVVFVALGWDRVGQQSGLRDRNFALKPQYTRALQVLAATAMVLAVWHVLNISYALAAA